MYRGSCHWCVIAFSALLAGLVFPSLGNAQTVSGQARAAQASVSGLFGIDTTVLSDTGTLSSSSDAREASQTTGNVSSLLSGEALHASTIGWPDQVASEASMAGVALNVAGTTIGADFVMARALSTLGATGAGAVNIDGLSINGLSIDVTGQPNQTVAIPGGWVVINEQQTSTGRSVVNALHVVVQGVADVVIATATAQVQ